MPKKKKPQETKAATGIAEMFDADASKEAAASTIPSDEILAQVSSLVRIQIELENEVEANEALLKRTKELLRKVSEVEIPEAFNDLGLSELALTTGEKIKVEKKIKASIPTGDKPESVTKREAAFNWLRAHEADALIKAELKTAFGKGKKEKELQAKAIKKLTELGVPVTIKESVHFQTLTAFVNERIEAGLVVDVELLGIIELSTTKIVRPKQ